MPTSEFDTLALELMELTNAADTMRQLFSMQIASLTEHMSTEEAQKFQAIINGLDINEYLNVLIPVFRDNFTIEMIQAVIVFYSSDAGKAFTAATPAVMAQCGPVAQAWAQKNFIAALEALEQGETEAEKAEREAFEAEVEAATQPTIH